MVLELSPQQLAEISAHAERAYPEECCGLMVGKICQAVIAEAGLGQTASNKAGSEKTSKQVFQLFPMSNEWSADAVPIADASTQSAASQSAASEHTTPDENSACQSVTLNSSFTSFTKARRYWIDPKDMLQVQKQARAQGLNIIGIYHSHPDQIAEPSECDRALAWPEYAYTIVSVRKGKAVDVQNWALDSEHQFQLEPISKVTHAEVIARSSPDTSASSAKDRMPISA